MTNTSLTLILTFLISFLVRVTAETPQRGHCGVSSMGAEFL
jgi:hypothetical protein